MLKKIILFALTLSLYACASTPAPQTSDTAPAAEPAAEPAAAPAAPATEAAAKPAEPAAPTDPNEKKLTEAYSLLSAYDDARAKKLIDEAIKAYKDQKDTERLATAYTVSTDYYRYVTNEKYKEAVKALKSNPEAAEPMPLYVVLGPTTSARVKQESKLAADTYKKVIAQSIAAKDHFKASMNFYRLGVHYFRNGMTPEGCKALDDTLSQFAAGMKIDPNHQMSWNKMRYPSYPDQIVDNKKSMRCK